jgi:hypothetical protein
VADRGYISSPETLACHEAGITVTQPKPATSEGRFGKQDDHRLVKLLAQSQCMTGPERRITRWEHEHLLDAV